MYKFISKCNFDRNQTMNVKILYYHWKKKNRTTVVNNGHEIKKIKTNETFTETRRIDKHQIQKHYLYSSRAISCIQLRITIEDTTFSKLYFSSPSTTQGNWFGWMRTNPFFVYNIYIFIGDQLNQSINQLNHSPQRETERSRRERERFFVEFSIPRYSSTFLPLFSSPLIHGGLLFQNNSLTKRKQQKSEPYFSNPEISPMEEGRECCCTLWLINCIPRE